jgi:FkbM family methyltransferase
VIDCGANVGLFALWVAQRCPHAQVLAFEPSPSTYDYSAEGPLIVLDCL